MTVKRRAALRKAQMASARKRRRVRKPLLNKKSKAAIAVGGVVLAQEIAGRKLYSMNKDIAKARFPVTPSGLVQAELDWHLGRGSARRHFAASHQAVLQKYQLGLKMTPGERGAYAQYRYARARIRYRRIKGLPPEHGWFHRSGLPHPGTSQRARLRKHQKRVKMFRNL